MKRPPAEAGGRMGQLIPAEAGFDQGQIPHATRSRPTSAPSTTPSSLRSSGHPVALAPGDEQEPEVRAVDDAVIVEVRGTSASAATVFTAGGDVERSDAEAGRGIGADPDQVALATDRGERDLRREPAGVVVAGERIAVLAAGEVRGETRVEGHVADGQKETTAVPSKVAS